ncbi:hypothetical+protein [Methylocapsa aurea]
MLFDDVCAINALQTANDEMALRQFLKVVHEDGVDRSSTNRATEGQCADGNSFGHNQPEALGYFSYELTDNGKRGARDPTLDKNIDRVARGSSEHRA